MMTTKVASAALLLLALWVLTCAFLSHAPDLHLHRSTSTHDDAHSYDDHQALQTQLRALQETQQRTLVLLNKILCDADNVLPSGGFCLDKSHLFVGGNYMWSAKLCAGLEALFGYSTVADLGAGLGHYGRCFLRMTEGILTHPNLGEVEVINNAYKHHMREAGLLDVPRVIKSWNGWDGAANIGEFTNGRIASADLSSPATLGGPFDWVMSLEVGEHIPESGEKNFLDNLVKHACVGVVLSWAVPGQGGHSHVNCRSNEYVRREMAARGLESDKFVEARLRAIVDLPHFKNTIMVFKFPRKRC
ncbi:uncharacterized protein [Procambarus clarkii]|uniref:uncharacterized protein n=1 Tax=Procambarus clarkii TaxID=6728 RepID=UPI001E672DD7|nr:uncharacterized protein LOC123758113 [Procambarus clarkii]